MHKSVLLNECLKYLNLRENSIVVDATLGYAGHSSNILKRIPNGYLYSFDQDEQAIKSSQQRLKEIDDNYEIIQSNFVNLEEELAKRITSVKAGDTTINVEAGSSDDTIDTGYNNNTVDANILFSFTKQLQSYRKFPAGCGKDLHGI